MTWRYTTGPDCIRRWAWYAKVGPAEVVSRLAGPCVRGAVVGLPLLATPGAVLFGPPAPVVPVYGPEWAGYGRSTGYASDNSGRGARMHPTPGGVLLAVPGTFSGDGAGTYGNPIGPHKPLGRVRNPFLDGADHAALTGYNPAGTLPGPATWPTLPQTPYVPPVGRPGGPPSVPTTLPPDVLLPPVDVPGRPPVEVPEPGTLLVMLVGVLAAVVWRRA